MQKSPIDPLSTHSIELMYWLHFCFFRVFVPFTYSSLLKDVGQLCHAAAESSAKDE